MLNENQFIHKKCNRLIMDTLENLKQKEIQSFWNELMDFIKKNLYYKFLSNSFIVKNTVNEFYKAFNSFGSFSNFFKCEFCSKIIKSGQEEKHLKFCEERNCTFMHIDGTICNYKFHKKNVHLNFSSFDNISNFSYEETDNNLIQIIKLNLIKNINKALIIKSLNINKTLHSITTNFKNNFRILSKKCNCLHFSKHCNCILHILNNTDTTMFFKRQKKNVFYAIKDLKQNNINLIGIIIIDYCLMDIKNSQQFNFISNLKNTSLFKIIYICTSEFNSNLIKNSLIKKNKISYHDCSTNQNEMYI